MKIPLRYEVGFFCIIKARLFRVFFELFDFFGEKRYNSSNQNNKPTFFYFLITKTHTS